MGWPVLDPFKLIRIALPSLLIFSVFSWARFEGATSYHEVFGNADTYLDISFQGAQRNSFEGVLVTDQGEEKISGKRVKNQTELNYAFESSQGKFSGKLVPGEKGCEPNLVYEFKSSGKKIQTGKLAAGFCL